MELFEDMKMFTDDGCVIQRDLVLTKEIIFTHSFKQAH